VREERGRVEGRDEVGGRKKERENVGSVRGQTCGKPTSAQLERNLKWEGTAGAARDSWDEERQEG
jgi:hypothetical protein